MSLSMQTAKARRIGNGQYMGDPGFLGDLWGAGKKVAGAGVRTALGLTGWGGAATAVGGAINLAQPGQGPPVGPAGTPAGAKVGGIRGVAERFFPGGRTGIGEGCQKGFHANKSSYHLKDGTFIEKGTVCVKDRRKNNPANATATSNAISRINSAKRMQAKLATISTAKYTNSGKERGCKL